MIFPFWSQAGLFDSGFLRSLSTMHREGNIIGAHETLSFIFYRDRGRLPISRGNTRPFLSLCSSWHHWVLNIRSGLSSQALSNLHHHIQRRLIQPSWLSRRESYNPWECCCFKRRVPFGIESRSDDFYHLRCCCCFFFRNWLICSEKQQIDFCLTHSLLEILRKNAFWS